MRLSHCGWLLGMNHVSNERNVQRSMERVKELNSFNDGNVQYGETTLSDLLEGEYNFGGEEPKPRAASTRDVKFPKPYLARYHTDKNVC